MRHVKNQLFICRIIYNMTSETCQIKIIYFQEGIKKNFFPFNNVLLSII